MIYAPDHALAFAVLRLALVVGLAAAFAAVGFALARRGPATLRAALGAVGLALVLLQYADPHPS